MGSWNYRVIEFVDSDGSPWRAIHEVHYEGDIPVSYRENPAVVMSSDDGGNEANLAWVLDRMREALQKPVLTEKDFRKSSSSA